MKIYSPKYEYSIERVMWKLAGNTGYPRALSFDDMDKAIEACKEVNKELDQGAIVVHFKKDVYLILFSSQLLCDNGKTKITGYLE